MKLILKRDQKAQTGLLGGHKGMTFILSCKAELTDDERALVAKYKAENHPLTFVTRNGVKEPSDTVRSLMNGVTQELKGNSGQELAEPRGAADRGRAGLAQPPGGVHGGPHALADRGAVFHAGPYR